MHTNNLSLKTKIDNKIIYMLSFSHFIDIYWNNDERSFNSLINQDNHVLERKIVAIQSKRDFFQILTINEIKLIIKDLYARRSLFIHFSKVEIDTKEKELKKIYYKIIKFKINNNQFNKTKVKQFINKYIKYLSSIIFIYPKEKVYFFNNFNNLYEKKLFYLFTMDIKSRYFDTHIEPINWYNQYFFNKINNLASGKRYNSFLLNYSNILNNIFKESRKKFFFKTYFIHKKYKIIDDKKYLLTKRHRNNSIVIHFNNNTKLREEIKPKFIFIDYKVFLILEFLKVYWNKKEKYREEKLIQIVKYTIAESKKREKIDNYFSIGNYEKILFSDLENKNMMYINNFSKEWFKNNNPVLNNKNYDKFKKNKFIYSFIYAKLNLDMNFSDFLKKYHKININEFLLYYFIYVSKKNIKDLKKIWNYFLEDFNNNNLNKKFVDIKIVRKLMINKKKYIYLAGNTRDFFRFYELVKNKKHILRIVKRNKIKNKNEYSIKYVWNLVLNTIILKLLNIEDNLYIVHKYEQARENNKFIINSLFHNYRNYIAHLGRGNEKFFISYKDYVQKKWKVKQIIDNNYFKKD